MTGTVYYVLKYLNGSNWSGCSNFSPNGSDNTATTFTLNNAAELEGLADNGTQFKVVVTDGTTQICESNIITLTK